MKKIISFLEENNFIFLFVLIIFLLAGGVFFPKELSSLFKFLFLFVGGLCSICQALSEIWKQLSSVFEKGDLS